MAGLVDSLAMPALSCRVPSSYVPSPSSSSSCLTLRQFPQFSGNVLKYRSGFSAIACSSSRIRFSLAGGKNPQTLVSRASSAFGPSHSSTGALTPEVKESLNKFLGEHKVVLFMKGNRMFPQCGFSNTVVQILNSMNVPYETVNILEDDGLRQGLKEYSNWPTFPQLYIDGEFFGGCDITLEAFQNGQLKEVLEKAMCS
ncbi:hypothetical protein O6H91_01G052300 [Diphasiastrum complanatum]|uniref:Uncharacterized protein n=1 Tax=Diphasiastrum complanatum TaxID=34168 RepID=A0ACC2EQZ9_DIPCM|nr:hypothetical protein O6H91_01G052300 [Diphasiastrum complanatum]